MHESVSEEYEGAPEVAHSASTDFWEEEYEKHHHQMHAAAAAAATAGGGGVMGGVGFDDEEVALAQQFFLISRVAFVAAFCVIYLAVPRLRRQVLSLRQVERKYIGLSAVGEVLCISGDFLCAYAYAWCASPSTTNPVRPARRHPLHTPPYRASAHGNSAPRRQLAHASGRLVFGLPSSESIAWRLGASMAFPGITSRALCTSRKRPSTS